MAPGESRFLRSQFPFSKKDKRPMATFAEIPWIKKHIELYQTDPEKAHMWDSAEAGGQGLLPTLLITTKGRKTGEPRSIPLIYKEVDGNYVVIGSKGESAGEHRQADCRGYVIASVGLVDRFQFHVWRARLVTQQIGNRAPCRFRRHHHHRKACRGRALPTCMKRCRRRP